MAGEHDFEGRAIIDLETGQIDEDLTGYVGELTRQLGIAERGRTVAESRYRKLLRESDAQLSKNPYAGAAMRVLEHWRELCHPGARELQGPRLRIVIERLDPKRAKPPYSEEQLIHAIDGFAAFPYVIRGQGRSASGTPAQKKVDVALILGDAKHVDMGLDLREESQRRATPPTAVISHIELGPMGRAAIRYAQHGWAVFPCRPRDKRPANQHGLLEANHDTERIANFWMAHPDFNIGVRCGLPSNLVVLDVDDRSGGLESLRELKDRYGPLPRTASFVTPGGGTHYYFRHPAKGELRNTTGFPGPGLDIRGNGGYVLAPPSVGANGRAYEVDERAPVAEMPDWLVQILVNRPHVTPFRADYAEMVRQGAKHGERNDALLKLTGHLWSHDHQPDEVLEMVQAVNVARCSPPLDQREVKKIVESVGQMRARQALRAVMAR
jgi:hypothetical protein